MNDMVMQSLESILAENQVRVVQQQSQYDLYQEYLNLGGNAFGNRGSSTHFQVPNNLFNPQQMQRSETPNTPDDILLQLADLQKQELDIRQRAEQPRATLPGAKKREERKLQEEMLDVQKRKIDTQAQLQIAQRANAAGRGLDPNSPYAKALAQYTQVPLTDIASGRYKPTAADNKQVSKAMEASAQMNNYLYALDDEDPQTRFNEFERDFQVGLESRHVRYNDKAFEELRGLKQQVKTTADLLSNSTDPVKDLQRFSRDSPFIAQVAREMGEEQLEALSLNKASTADERQNVYRNTFARLMEIAVGQHQAQYLQDLDPDTLGSVYIPEETKTRKTLTAEDYDVAAVVAEMRRLGPSEYPSGIERLSTAVKNLSGSELNVPLARKMVTAALQNYQRRYAMFGVQAPRFSVEDALNKHLTRGVLEQLSKSFTESNFNSSRMAQGASSSQQDLSQLLLSETARLDEEAKRADQDVAARRGDNINIPQSYFDLFRSGL